MANLVPGQVELLPMTHEQVAALASSACSEVFAAFDSIEPLSAREVAAELGKSPGAVHDHLQILLTVGLLVPAGTRKRRSRTETLYVHRGRITRFVLREHPWETVELYLDRFRSQMRRAERLHELAQRAMRHDRGFIRFFTYKHHTMRLSPTNADRLQQAIADLHRLAQELGEPTGTEPPEGSVRVTLTTLVLPSAAASRSRLSGADDPSDNSED